MYKSKVNSHRRFFEGWYFRLTDPIRKKSLALIPGISLGTDSHAFVQIITDECETDYHRFALSEFSVSKKPLIIKVGSNLFSTQHLQLHLTGKIKVKGLVKFTDLSPLRFNLMGPFGWLPNLPCYHQIISMKHYANGTLSVNNKTWNSAEIGYIETDKGHSFPHGHIWLQCNTFTDHELSLSLAVSEITWRRRSIPVCYALLTTPQQNYYLTTWLGAKTKLIAYQGRNLQVVIQQRSLALTVDVLLPENYTVDNQLLVSPVNGDMHSHVNEILTADIRLSLTKNSKKILTADGIMCAAEINNIEIL